MNKLLILLLTVLNLSSAPCLFCSNEFEFLDNQPKIHQAIAMGAVRVVKKLIDDGCDIDELSLRGNTPLFWAAATGRLEIVKLLLKHGADPETISSDGDQPIDAAVGVGHENIVLILLPLLKTNKDLHLFEISILSGNLNIIKMFASKVGSDALSQALRVAATRGYNCKEIMEFLIDLGANPSFRKEDSSLSLIHFVAMMGDVDVMDLLVSRNLVNINARSSLSGATPLHLAIGQGNENMVSFLLDHGAKVNAKSMIGNTPLHSAVSKYLPSIVELLMKHGASMSALNKEKKTAIDIANDFWGTTKTEELLKVLKYPSQ
jgi:ankyrin repeat protein